MGPVGAFVKVKPEYEPWVKAIETTLGEKWRAYLGEGAPFLSERCSSCEVLRVRGCQEGHRRSSFFLAPCWSLRCLPVACSALPRGRCQAACYGGEYRLVEDRVRGVQAVHSVSGGGG
jgi:hypothetical protein